MGALDQMSYNPTYIWTDKTTSHLMPGLEVKHWGGTAYGTKVNTFGTVENFFAFTEKLQNIKTPVTTTYDTAGFLSLMQHSLARSNQKFALGLNPVKLNTSSLYAT